tara:strand:- start:164 stop:721 length:558 start_codon:yes stop_codon:yes gene_type:complete
MEFTILKSEYFDNRNNKEWFYTISKVKNTELFATHLYNKTDNTFSSGHYDDSYNDVLKDFKNRCRIAKKHKVRLEKNELQDTIEKTKQASIKYNEWTKIRKQQPELSKKYEVWKEIDNCKIKVGVIRSKQNKKYYDEKLFLPNTWKVYGGLIRYFSKVGKPTPELALKNLQNARGGSYELREITN